MTERIRAVVISAGAWSQSSHLPTLAAHPLVDIIAVSSPDFDLARALAEEFGAKRAESQWTDALTCSPDIVVVSSPPIAHEEQVIAALRAGAHVLVEKPFALDAGAAQRMHAAAQEAQRALLVGFGWPAAPIFALAKSLIDENEVGSIEHITMHLAVNTRALLSGGLDGGWGGVRSSSSTTYTDRGVSGGGAAAVSMSHQLGLIGWLTGERIENVAASTYPRGSAIDLHVSVNAGLSGGGSAAISTASTHPYSTRPQWHLALYGDRGQIWLDSMNDQLRLVRSNGEVVEYQSPQASGVYDAGAPTTALIYCALGEPAPASLSSVLAVHVVEVTDSIYASADSGSTVPVGQA